MGYYTGKIKVRCEDRMCFAVNPKTLEPLACSTYDAYAFSDPDREPLETIDYGEWCRRKDEYDRLFSDTDRGRYLRAAAAT